MVRVKGHYRRAKSGKQIWVRGYTRGRGGFQKIPVRTNNPTVRATIAEYDSVAKTSNINIIDEESDKIIFVAQNIPQKVDEVIVDERDDVGVVITSKSKKKDQITGVIVTRKDI